MRCPGPRRLRHMTIHKLNAEAAPKAMPPLDLSVVLNHREYQFPNAIVRARIARAMSAAPAHYPIHRLVRCAVRSKLQPLFDDVAMKVGVEAHRLENGWVLLDGPGLFASVWGAWKAGYSSFVAHVWAESPAHHLHDEPAEHRRHRRGAAEAGKMLRLGQYPHAATG